MKEAPGSSETSVLTRATRHNNPADTILHIRNLHFGHHKELVRKATSTNHPKRSSDYDIAGKILEELPDIGIKYLT
jgi:hypothetical protein